MNQLLQGKKDYLIHMKNCSLQIQFFFFNKQTCLGDILLQIDSECRACSVRETHLKGHNAFLSQNTLHPW